MRDIQPLVAPRSIAVIGASTNPNKSGGVLFSNLAGGKLRGKLYPINPNATEVMGLKAYPSVGAIPEKVDLVYIVLPDFSTSKLQSSSASRRVPAPLALSRPALRKPDQKEGSYRTVSRSRRKQPGCCLLARTRSGW